jgi:hypothetical protein
MGKKNKKQGGKKKGQKGPNAKTVKREKDKIVKDLTFGLKNKNKSKKV